MMDIGRGADGRIVVTVDGTFDAPAATRLAAWLAEVPGERAVVVDFTRVRSASDLGIAAVARGLAGREHRLAVRGLTRHHERLLRYFGVSLHAAAEAADAEEAL